MKKFVFFLVFVLGVLSGFSIYVYHFHNLRAPVVTSNNEVLLPPPTYLDVRGDRWLVWESNLSSASPASGTGSRVQADTDCEWKEIRYDAKAINSQDEFREVLWHEVLHAEHCGITADSIEASNWGPDTKDIREHASVYEVGMFLPGFVHDNPDFMKWAEDWK